MILKNAVKIADNILVCIFYSILTNTCLKTIADFYNFYITICTKFKCQRKYFKI